jgi:outer membrane receptor protein involved in Fe transport
LGDSGLAYRLIADKQNVAYWRNSGSIDQTVIAPSRAWYGENTKVSIAYEHMDYSVPFDRGTQINPKTGKGLDIPRNALRRILKATRSRHDGAGVEYYLPSSTVADAFVSYKMKIEDRDLTLQLNLKNVFDECYDASSSGLGSPAIVIGKPRQWVARAKLDF